ncbi:hypothetical protein DITRI_Ditri19aG0099700 [Diplodiscus trichospermus]
MKTISWNVHGLGRREKQRAVRKLLAKGKFQFIFLQETKISDSRARLPRWLWSSAGYKAIIIDSEGRLEGLLTGWNKEFFALESQIVTSRFILIIGIIKPLNLRLDRFLVASEFLLVYPTLKQKLWPKSISDHNPISISVDDLNWGPKPFKFFNHWLEEENYHKVVMESWARLQEGNLPQKSLRHKLKCLNEAIKEWYLTEGAADPYQINKLMDEIHNLEVSPIGDRPWGKLGRRLSKRNQFYGLFLERKRDLGIRNLGSNGFEKIKEVVAHHFETHFCQNIAIPINEFDCAFNRLMKKSAQNLEKPFTELEIWKAVQESENDKALGPDNFNLDFFKAHWRKVTLIKSILGNLPIYYMSLFKMPGTIKEKLDRIQRRFLWGNSSGKRKTHWVGWNHVYNFQMNRELGIMDLNLQNRALLNKWFFRYSVESNALWRRIIDSSYGGNCNNLLLQVHNFRKFSRIRKDITKPLVTCDELSNFFTSRIGYAYAFGDGSKILVWKNEWIPRIILRLSYPRIYALANNKRATIHECDSYINNQWAWSIPLRCMPFGWE